MRVTSHALCADVATRPWRLEAEAREPGHGWGVRCRSATNQVGAARTRARRERRESTMTRPPLGEETTAARAVVVSTLSSLHRSRRST
jgi:hypothetical protein